MADAVGEGLDLGRSMPESLEAEASTLQSLSVLAHAASPVATARPPTNSLRFILDPAINGDR